MDVSGQLHVPAALAPGKELPVGVDSSHVGNGTRAVAPATEIPSDVKRADREQPEHVTAQG
jgi:hypothetical protein